MAIQRRTPGGTVATADPKSTHSVRTTEVNPRVAFRGSEKTARAYVENNHPRLHVNPGDDWGQDGPMPDVVLVTPDGEEYWNGEEWIKEADSPWASEPVERGEAPAPDIPAGQHAVYENGEWVLQDGPDDGADTGVVTEQPTLA